MKKVYTIPPDVPFIDALVDGLLRDAVDDPLVLADRLVLLPTRRSCLHLREAFRRRMNGRAMLLPRMQPLGDLDEDELYFTADSDTNPNIPPAITPLRRQLLLTRMIAGIDAAMPLDQAALLADALARLLDEVQTEQRDFSGLEKLVTEKELACHWEKTVTFLNILTQNWPEILASEGCIDPADRRNRVFTAQAQAWKSDPPAGPVIAAGSTGSMPATARLLKVIASLPQGAVILPGLDRVLPEDAWQEISESHPQYNMKKLLEQFDVKRADVKLWNASEGKRPARIRLLQESMRPAEVSDGWRDLNRDIIPPEVLKGMTRLVLDHPQEEARAIALLMRQALETPGKTAALVTPDRHLAERVGAVLDRWDIRINDSAGTSLSTRPIGSFLTDLLSASSSGATSVDILSLLKHPLTAFGLSPAACRARARQIEIDIWRMPRRRDVDRKTESEAALREIRQSLHIITASWHDRLPLTDRIDAHRRLAEHIANSESETGAERLWRGEEGEAAATWLNDWGVASHDFPHLAGDEYLELFKGILRTATIRPVWGLHPRLSILGPLEARLIHADLVILGGLNESVWPPETRVDPWMSRPMKKDFGLPLPERRLGLSAHDFVQLASAEEVVLTRAARMEGAPSVPSRFVLQIETVLHALRYSDDATDALAPHEPWRDWAHALDEPDRVMPCAPPDPRPAAKDRPMRLSVSDIGTWRRNPYAIYAEHILKLTPLDPLDTRPQAAEHGTLLHETLDAFMKKYPKDLPSHALDELLSLGRSAFLEYADHPEVQAFWWPRFERTAEWFVKTELARRADGITFLQGEATGRFLLNQFTLKGRADRIERLPDGSLGIVDYKTGQVPAKKDVEAGYEPQLPLLALIATEGGFGGIAASSVSDIAYWYLNGKRDGSRIEARGKDIVSMISRARNGLEKLIEKFADPATPYEAVPKPGFQPRYDKYAHLARLQEWGRTEDSE